MNLHVICRGRLNLKHIGQGRYQTGVWKISVPVALSATHVWLHEGQQQAAYHGGKVISWRKAKATDALDDCPHDVEQRIVIEYEVVDLRKRKVRALGQWRSYEWTTSSLDDKSPTPA